MLRSHMGALAQLAELTFTEVVWRKMDGVGWSHYSGRLHASRGATFR